MKTHKFLGLIFLVALGGCLKDDGTYEYLDLNEVQEIKGIEDFYSITKFEDTLRIAPEVHFKMEVSGDYAYEWSVNHWELSEGENKRENVEIVISTDKNLEFVADYRIPYKDLFAVYKVTNINTGVEHREKFEIRVQNAYQYGYFFLCEKESDSELFLVRENGKTIPDLYETLTGTRLKGNPYQMESIKNGIWTDLVIFASEGPDYGAVMDLDNLDYKWPAVKCFHEENVGESMEVNFFTRPDRDIYTIINGNYYFTGGMAFGDYKPYIGVNVPDVPEKTDYVDQVSFALSFLHGTDPGTVYAPGQWGAIATVEMDGEPLVLPGKCYFMAAEPGGNMYGGGVDTHIFVKDHAGVVTECVFNSKMDFSTWTNVYSLIQKETFVASALVTDETKFINSYSERYFYFTSENKIYRYNYDAPADTPALIAELPAGQSISYIYLDYTQEGYSKFDDQFVVAAYDHTGVQNGSIYFVNMDGSIETAYEHVCGKIVDLVVKK